MNHIGACNTEVQENPKSSLVNDYTLLPMEEARNKPINRAFVEEYTNTKVIGFAGNAGLLVKRDVYKEYSSQAKSEHETSQENSPKVEYSEDDNEELQGSLFNVSSQSISNSEESSEGTSIDPIYTDDSITLLGLENPILHLIETYNPESVKNEALFDITVETAAYREAKEVYEEEQKEAAKETADSNKEVPISDPVLDYINPGDVVFIRGTNYASVKTEAYEKAAAIYAKNKN